MKFLEPKIPKLSQAIRKGAEAGPQCFYKPLGLGGGSCALGAAYLAVGKWWTELTGAGGAWTDLFRRMRHAVCPVPGCGEIPGKLVASAIIIHLNDDHQWTREHIADWVEQFESDPVAEPVSETEAVCV
jgi:hypothetical protein